MTHSPPETPSYDHFTASPDDISDEVVTVSFPRQHPSLFHRIVDSFKRPSPSENASMTTNELNQEGSLNDNTDKNENGLHRSLQNRHLQMIAIGGAIGTGLFVGSGYALATGGPGAVVLDFIIIAFMIFNVCMALGELCVAFPVSGSFTIHSSRFLDPAWGFAMGWNYALHMLIVIPMAGAAERLQAK